MVEHSPKVIASEEDATAIYSPVVGVQLAQTTLWITFQTVFSLSGLSINYQLCCRASNLHADTRHLVEPHQPHDEVDGEQAVVLRGDHQRVA